MNIKTALLSGLLAAFLIPQTGNAQALPADVLRQLEQLLDAEARREVSVGAIRIDSVATTGNTLQLFANDNCSYIPFREENVKRIYQDMSQLLPSTLTGHRIQLFAHGRLIEDCIPQALRSKKDKKALTFSPAPTKSAPLVSRKSAPYIPTNGLQNRHIALWQSHGFYYEAKLDRWEWQRARIFQTVEDLYTQSYVLPFLVPMLENAGANVLLPRERDTRSEEVIVDNDGCLQGNSLYTEYNADKQWSDGNDQGFAHLRPVYKNFENPFNEGTYRQIETIRKGEESLAEWRPEIPESGEYAVYVSYRSLPNSAEDAQYTVYHCGGRTTFSVNQTMGGGTWIYLGTFKFDKGVNGSCKVTLSNRSDKAGRVVTADAVKIGGGMGNIARSRSVQGTTENLKSSDTRNLQANTPANTNATETFSQPQTSTYPRFCEAARYWLQWAGIPDSVYSESQGKNDYTDDYKCRAFG